MNTYDTGLLQKRFQSQGFVDSRVSAIAPRVHVINSCAVTAEATCEAVKLARRLKVKDPFCRVVVTGCAAQVDTEKFAGVDLVVANSHKGKLETLIRGLFNGETTERIYKSNIFKKDDLEAGGGLETDHTRSFLKIQDGCNSFCSFCVIPFARGKSRSISILELVKRVNDLHVSGVQEAVLTGVHIGDYEDGEKRLEDLVETLLAKTKLPRFRLSSLEPIEISPRLLELYKDPRLCPHFHMSIQSANTKVLSDMKRKYTSADVESALQEIAKIPDVFVGMDVIAGFPGETEDEFADTYNRLARLPWTRLHVFPYSERPGTKASRMENRLDRGLIKARARQLNELSRERFMARASEQIGRSKVILGLKSRNIDKLAKSQTNRGLSRDYWNIETLEDINLEGEFAVKVIGHVGFDQKDGNPYLTAELL